MGPTKGRAGITLNFATNRAVDTDNSADRQNYEDDKEYAASPQPQDLLHKHEDALLLFLVDRSKEYIIKKAAALYGQDSRGLGTSLNRFSKKLTTAMALVTYLSLYRYYI